MKSALSNLCSVKFNCKKCTAGDFIKRAQNAWNIEWQPFLFLKDGDAAETIYLKLFNNKVKGKQRQISEDSERQAWFCDK